jgi:hypothetical protein
MGRRGALPIPRSGCPISPVKPKPLRRLGLYATSAHPQLSNTAQFRGARYNDPGPTAKTHS